MTKSKNDLELNELLKQLEKQYGKEAIVKLDDKVDRSIQCVSTGSFKLDNALGIGGYPKGRIIEIFGPESSGKTTLALHAIAEVQKLGGKAVFIDAEHALDIKYAKNLGVNTKELLLSQPDHGEQALEITDALIASRVIDIIVIDSVAALTPKAEIEGEISDQTVASQARLMSKSLRVLSSSINKSNCIVIFINQIREKVGVVFGNPETTPGGRALKFYSSIRIDIRPGEKIKNDTNFVAQISKVKIVKNKVAPPFRQTPVKINFNKGIDKLEEIVDLAIEANIIIKSGSWYFYQNEKIGQGKEVVITWLKTNKKINSKITKQVVESIG